MSAEGKSTQPDSGNWEIRSAECEVFHWVQRIGFMENRWSRFSSASSSIVKMFGIKAIHSVVAIATFNMS
jgi:hypothetical protein